jgi:GDP-L-fucose synthase
MLSKSSKIFVAGHRGMIGSAILRKLKYLKYQNIFYQTKRQLDLKDQRKVNNYLKKIRPDAVILAAAKVGGIKANNENKAEFIFDNLSIQNNVIDCSYRNGVKRLIFLGSSCVYPKNSRIPIKEEYLLSNYLEKTNEPYAIAKIAGISLCESYNSQYGVNYKCLMPCNAYGINDNYDLNNSHFFPALIRKIISAMKNKEDHIYIWGSGSPLRELIYCDDIADACIFFLKKKTKHSLINIGTGKEKTINEYAKYIMKYLGVKLKIKHKNPNLDGTYRKLMDNSLALKYGWKSKTNLDVGIALTINDYLKKQIFK